MDQLKDAPRHTVENVYHATDKEGLTEAEQLDMLTIGEKLSLRCSHFSCRLWHRDSGELASPDENDGRPTVSPWASNHVVIPTLHVLENPDDFLIPLKKDIRRNTGGRTDIEMVYIRCNYVLEKLDTPYRDLHEWQLSRNPIIQLERNGRLHYPVLPDLWFIILTPYNVPISGDAKWEKDLRTKRQKSKPRVVEHDVAKKVLEGLFPSN